jgi:hypothetical protein
MFFDEKIGAEKSGKLQKKIYQKKLALFVEKQRGHRWFIIL